MYILFSQGRRGRRGRKGTKGEKGEQVKSILYVFPEIFSQPAIANCS